MNKIVRSLLLKTPQVYDFIHNLKNNYFLSFYLNKVHDPDFNAFKLICGDRPQIFLDDKVHKLLQDWEYDIYKFFNCKFYLDRFDCANNFFVFREKTEMVRPYLANSILI
jgi:hypothetical protein